MQLNTKQNLHLRSLSEVYFSVADARASAEWYQRHFGLTEVESAQGRMSLRLVEGALLTLLEDGGVESRKAMPIQFQAGDAMQVYRSLDLTAVDSDAPERFHQYTDFTVRDPDGNQFNVISDPAWPQHPNNLFRINGVFIGVQDIERAHAWYSEILGAEVEYDFTYPTAQLPAARHICYRGIPVSLVECPMPMLSGRFCDFTTEDLAADRAFLQSCGVQVTEAAEIRGQAAFAFYDLDDREFGLVASGAEDL